MPVLYEGSGDTKIALDVFKQLHQESARAVGIVAGSIVESRLESALKVFMANDKEIIGQLFRPSGPLGPFSVKIDIAYLLGIISEAARRDLLIIKNVRNDFAHNLEIDSFDLDTIKSRCLNLRLIEQTVRKSTERADLKEGDDSVMIIEIDNKPIWIGWSGAAKHIQDAKTRYVETAKLISFHLGRNADKRILFKPYI